MESKFEKKFGDIWLLKTAGLKKAVKAFIKAELKANNEENKKRYLVIIDEIIKLAKKGRFI